jgi:hypothetical protein
VNGEQIPQKTFRFGENIFHTLRRGYLQGEVQLMNWFIITICDFDLHYECPLATYSFLLIARFISQIRHIKYVLEMAAEAVRHDQEASEHAVKVRLPDRANGTFYLFQTEEKTRTQAILGDKTPLSLA